MFRLTKILALLIAVFYNEYSSAQLKNGIYKNIESCQMHEVIRPNCTNFELKNDNFFDFEYITPTPCRAFVWFSGKWKQENDILFLIDTISWKQDCVYFKEPVSTNNMHLILKAYSPDNSAIPNLAVLYIFNKEKDTLISHTGIDGIVQFEILDTDRYNSQKDIKESESFLLINYTNPLNGKQFSQVIYTYEPANFEVVIFESPKTISVVRTSLYRYKLDKLNYLYTYFSDKNYRDLDRQIYTGIFEFENY